MKLNPYYVAVFIFIYGIAMLFMTKSLLTEHYYPNMKPHYNPETEIAVEKEQNRVDTLYIDTTDSQFKKSIYVTATCYNPVKEQCNSSFWLTADMSIIDTIHPEKHRWIAVSRDLLSKGLSMGDTVDITGTWVYDGKWVIHDKMNSRYRNRIDFLIKPGMYLDKWHNVKVSF